MDVSPKEDSDEELEAVGEPSHKESEEPSSATEELTRTNIGPSLGVLVVSTKDHMFQVPPAPRILSDSEASGTIPKGYKICQLLVEKEKLHVLVPCGFEAVCTMSREKKSDIPKATIILVPSNYVLKNKSHASKAAYALKSFKGMFKNLRDAFSRVRFQSNRKARRELGALFVNQPLVLTSAWEQIIPQLLKTFLLTELKMDDGEKKKKMSIQCTICLPHVPVLRKLPST